MDYAAATPGKICPGTPYTHNPQGGVCGGQNNQPDLSVYWGGRTSAAASNTVVPTAGLFEGVIVRTPWFSNKAGPKAKVVDSGTPSGGTAPTSNIKDGTSSTMVVGEKFVYRDHISDGWPTTLTAGQGGSDYHGWAGGWGPDTICSTAWPPVPDISSDDPAAPADPTQNPRFGAAHSSGFNAVFGDASTHYISYNIDPVIFDCMGNRQDQNPADLTKYY